MGRLRPADSFAAAAFGVDDITVVNAAERYKKIQEFAKHYKYAPAFDLGQATAGLCAEVGEVATAVIRTKIQRLRSAS